MFSVTDILPTALDHSSGTATNSINSNYFPNPEWIDEPRPASRYPYTYPYFLFPPSHKIPLALASHRPATSDTNAHYIAPALYNHTSNSFSSGHAYEHEHEHELDESTNSHKHFNHTNLMHKFQHNTSVKQHNNDFNAHQHHHHSINKHNNNNNHNNVHDGDGGHNHSITASQHNHSINQHDLRKLQLDIGEHRLFLA